jgi:leader peptidase (prepilin peptidase)/N-methyltransferase
MVGPIIWAILGVAVGIRNASRAGRLIVEEQTFGRVFSWGHFHQSALFAPLAIAATSLSFYATAATFERNITVLAFAFFINALIVNALIDIDTHLLLRRVNIRAWWRGTPWLIIAAMIDHHEKQVLTMIVGALVAWSFMQLLRVIGRGQLGGGDVSIAALIGWYVGWIGLDHVAVALVMGFIVGGAFSLIGLTLGALKRNTSFSFGPFLALGALVSLWWGNDIWSWMIGR